MKLENNSSIQLKIYGTGKLPKWSSSNKNIATVNTKGIVVGKKGGTAVITAKIGNKEYTCKITVPNIIKRQCYITKLIIIKFNIDLLNINVQKIRILITL